MCGGTGRPRYRYITSINLDCFRFYSDSPAAKRLSASHALPTCFRFYHLLIEMDELRTCCLRTRMRASMTHLIIQLFFISRPCSRRRNCRRCNRSDSSTYSSHLRAFQPEPVRGAHTNTSPRRRIFIPSF